MSAASVEGDDDDGVNRSVNNDVQQARSTEAYILRAFRPFFWLQAVLGTTRLSIQGDIAAPKSLLSSCHSGFLVVLYVYLVCDTIASLFNNQEARNIIVKIILFSEILMMTFMYGSACFFKHKNILIIFKEFAKFDDINSVVGNEEYERSLNKRAHILSFCILAADIILCIFLLNFIFLKGTALFMRLAIAEYSCSSVKVEMLYCMCLVEQAMRRLRILEVGLEQMVAEVCAGAGSVAVVAELSPQCRVSHAILKGYSTICVIVKRINVSFKYSGVCAIVVLLATSTLTSSFIYDSINERTVPFNAILYMMLRIATTLSVLCLLSTACERLAVQHSRLVSTLIEMSINANLYDPAMRRRARHIAQAMTSSRLSFSLWAGCEVRATFIPVLLCLFMECLLLSLQLPCF